MSLVADTILARMAEEAAAQRAARHAKALRKALRHVDGELIEWRVTVGPSGGFTGIGGTTITEPALLIALWELRAEGLICLRGNVVTLTRAGERELDGSVTRG